MNYKRLLAILLCLALVLSVAACKKDTDDTKKKPSKKPQQSTSDVVSDDDNLITDNSNANTGNLNYDLDYDFSIKDDILNWASGLGSSADETVSMSILEGPARKVKVATQKTVLNDFYGLGTVCIPTTLMENNLKNGYNRAYWELEKKRITMLNQKIVRIWFQIDWFESDKGVYNFESPKMKAFYEYMDLFKELGTEVSINFSWKNGTAIQDWFPIKGVDPNTSAPQDVEHYAKDVSLFLHEMIEVRGYTNLKYLHYYNEPSGYDDFRTPGSNEEYFAKLSNAVHKQLVKDGRRNLVKIWGPECTWYYDSTLGQSWAEYFMEKAPGTFDIASFHAYGFPANSQLKNFSQMKKSMNNLPVVISEYGWSETGFTGFDEGFANYLINGANSGINGFTTWLMHGCWCEDPQEWANLSTGNFCLWNAPQVDINANESFYEFSLLSQYIPEHSEVLKTEVDSGDVRATTFKSGNDYTVVVEFKGLKSDRNLTIDFDTAINKSFNKFVYKGGITPDANALIPACSKTISVNSSLVDNDIEEEYSYVIYTTLSPKTQISLNPVEYTVASDETVKINASVIDNSNKNLVWSVVSGRGSISSTGVYKPAKDSRPGQMIAVKAASADDPSSYGIALITIE